jgi:exosortase
VNQRKTQYKLPGYPLDSRHALQILGRRELRHTRVWLILALLILPGITAWSYWPAIADLFDAWQKNDDYSAGQLVPWVAVFLVWRERKSIRQCLVMPCWRGGVTLLISAEIARTYGFLSTRLWVEEFSFILTVAGLVLLMAGRQVFRRVVWILLFLFLMVPLPVRLHTWIAGPLQRLATTGSVVLLEAVGAEVSQQGNVVLLGENTPIAVAEACSGLRMLMAFIIVAAFIAYMAKRPRWQKGVLLASSIPVAVLCNIVRIFATAVLMLHVSSEVGEKFFHDFAGLVMMPVAVILLFGELWLMDRVIVPTPQSQPRQVDARAEPATQAGAKPPEMEGAEVAPTSS